MSIAKKYKVISSELIGIFRVVLCQKDNILYVAGTSNSQACPRSCDPSEFAALPLHRLDLANIHPPYTDSMTKATGILDSHKYVKRPVYLKTLCYVSYKELLGSDKVASVIRREISTCEILKKNPHPNIAKYFGVDTSREVSIQDSGVVQTFRHEVVTGLAFERYERDLESMVANGQRIDITKVTADVKAGIEHLHSLGIVHADIKPANIFHKDGRFVIGDFDSAHIIGKKYRIKSGTDGWIDPNWEFADYRHDSFGLERVRRWLEDASAR